MYEGESEGDGGWANGRRLDVRDGIGESVWSEPREDEWTGPVWSCDSGRGM